jgi:hypothetical protein
MPAAALKRSRPAAPGVEPGIHPLPARALPEAVWTDYVVPLLTCKDAARLGCTCKAMRGLVREHFKDLGTIDVKTLQAALTTFPRARSVVLKDDRDEWADGENEALLQWLREGGRGSYLEAMMVEETDSPASILVHEALQAGCPPLAPPGRRQLGDRASPSLAEARLPASRARAASEH